jgi:hypothetical protein
MAKVPNIKDQLSKEYEAGVRAAAQLAGTYNAVTNHAYSLEDCILFKLGYLDKKKVRKVNTVISLPRRRVRRFASLPSIRIVSGLLGKWPRVGLKIMNWSACEGSGARYETSTSWATSASP